MKIIWLIKNHKLLLQYAWDCYNTAYTKKLSPNQFRHFYGNKLFKNFPFKE